MDFHITGALEFLVNHVVHARAGFDQRRGDNRERTTFLDVTRRTEETLRALQRVGVDTAGQHLARRGHHGVVGARQAGDGIEQNHHIFFVFDQALGFFDHHLRDLYVARGGFVECRRDDFSFDRASHLSHLLGALVDEQHHEMYFGMIGGNRVSNVLHQHGLTGLGRRHQQPALTLADGRDNVDDAPGNILFRLNIALEPQRLGGM